MKEITAPETLHTQIHTRTKTQQSKSTDKISCKHIQVCGVSSAKLCRFFFFSALQSFPSS